MQQIVPTIFILQTWEDATDAIKEAATENKLDYDELKKEVNTLSSVAFKSLSADDFSKNQNRVFIKLERILSTAVRNVKRREFKPSQYKSTLNKIKGNKRAKTLGASMFKRSGLGSIPSVGIAKGAIEELQSIKQTVNKANVLFRTTVSSTVRGVSMDILLSNPLVSVLPPIVRTPAIAAVTVYAVRSFNSAIFGNTHIASTVNTAVGAVLGFRTGSTIAGPVGGVAGIVIGAILGSN